VSGDKSENKSNSNEAEAADDDVNLIEAERAMKEQDFIGDEQSDGDFMYVDDAFIEQMDNDEEEGDDFKTMKESDIGSEDAGNFMDGEIIEGDLNLENDSVCQLSLVHQDHVYCVS